MTADLLTEGETVLLLDKSENRRLVRLRAGAKAHGHRGYLEHDRIIGQREGVLVRSSTGATFLVFRPRLADYVLEMPRKSAIIYPKDAGFILLWADIYPGATVIESGMGSGGLTLALLRAVGPTGQVIVYEHRADMIEAALQNLRGFTPPTGLGAPLDDEHRALLDDAAALDGEERNAPSEFPNLIVRNQDIYEGLEETEVDRIILDLSEPWRVLPHALDVLRPGGMLACYSPSIVQVQRTVEELNATRAFAQTETLEVLYRPWHLKGQAVRPVQQMVSHTAFLTFSRRVAARGRRPDDDVPDGAETVEAPADEIVEHGVGVGAAGEDEDLTELDAL
ncbi:MAG: tRNA (adenine-N1)-methyltransferase [Chloroflexi bacterium]|nr:tRNA (adenine-N1)-methyltransferase [Chloroflexota bacterium]